MRGLMLCVCCQLLLKVVKLIILDRYISHMLYTPCLKKTSPTFGLL